MSTDVACACAVGARLGGPLRQSRPNCLREIIVVLRVRNALVGGSLDNLGVAFVPAESLVAFDGRLAAIAGRVWIVRKRNRILGQRSARGQE